LFCVSFWWQRWENIILSDSGQNWNEMDNKTFNTYKRFTMERKRQGTALKPLICKSSKQPFISIDDKVYRQGQEQLLPTAEV